MFSLSRRGAHHALFSTLLGLWLAACASTPPPVNHPPIVRFAPPNSAAVLALRGDALDPAMDLLREPEALAQELKPYLVSKLGADLTQAESLVLYGTGTMPPELAIFARMAPAEGGLKGAPAGEHGGVKMVVWEAEGKMVAAQLDDGILFGNPEAVKRGIDASLAPPTEGPIQQHMEQAMANASLDALLTINGEALSGNKPEALTQFGVTGLTASFDKQHTAVVRVHTASPESAQRLLGVANVAIAGALEEARAEKEEAKANSEALEALFHITVYHQLRDVSERMKREVTGSDLTFRYAFEGGHSLTQWMVLGAYVGALIAGGDDEEDGTALAFEPEAPQEEETPAPTGPTYELPVPADRPSMGAADAPVVIQTFSDFQCPFCSRVVPTLDKVFKTYPGKILLVFRYYPLPFHEHAMPAAEAAHEVFVQQGSAAFFRYHNLLFENQRDLEREHLERYAEQLGGIDMMRFRSALDDHRHVATVQSDLDAVKEAGMRIGTPSFVINGKLLQGAQPLPAFKATIDGALRESRQLEVAR